MYLPVDVELLGHPKLMRLAGALNVTQPEAMWHLLHLWRWAMQYAPDGDLTGSTPMEIAIAAQWLNGDVERFVDVLASDLWRGSGFIDRERNGSVTLHDWSDGGGKLDKKREQGRLRQKRYRDKQRDIDVTQDVTPPVTRHVTEQGKESKRPSGESAPARARLAEEFALWWEKSRKVGSRADAEVLYFYWRKKGASANDLLTAIVNDRANCDATGTLMRHGRTFLAKTPNRWQEWVNPERPVEPPGKPMCSKCGCYLTATDKGALHCPDGCDD